MFPATALFCLALVAACTPAGPERDPDVVSLIQLAETRVAEAWPATAQETLELEGWMSVGHGESVDIRGSVLRRGEDFRLDTLYNNGGRAASGRPRSPRA